MTNYIINVNLEKIDVYETQGCDLVGLVGIQGACIPDAQPSYSGLPPSEKGVEST